MNKIKRKHKSKKGMETKNKLYEFMLNKDAK